MTVDEVQAIIAEADLNGDGKLDYAEFCHMLLNTSEECTQAFQNNALQVLKAKEKYKRYGSPKQQIAQRRSSFDRRERRREEIRMQLYSYSPDTKGINREAHKLDMHENERMNLGSQKLTCGESLESSLPPLSGNSQAESSDVKKGRPPTSFSSERVDVTNPEIGISAKLPPPLKRVPLPPLLDSPVNNDQSAIGTNKDGDTVEQKDKFQEEKKDRKDEDKDNVSVERTALSNPVDNQREPTDRGAVRQTDHLQEDEETANGGQGEKEFNTNDGQGESKPLGESDNKSDKCVAVQHECDSPSSDSKGVKVMGGTVQESDPLSKGVDLQGEEKTMESGEGEAIQEASSESRGVDLRGEKKILESGNGAAQEANTSESKEDLQGEEKGEGAAKGVELGKDVKTGEGAAGQGSDSHSSDKGIEVNEEKEDSIRKVVKEVVSTSVIAAPPKMPKNIKV